MTVITILFAFASAMTIITVYSMPLVARKSGLLRNTFVVFLSVVSLCSWAAVALAALRIIGALSN